VRWELGVEGMGCGRAGEKLEGKGTFYGRSIFEVIFEYRLQDYLISQTHCNYGHHGFLP
jgi:hypothetical protein